MINYISSELYRAKKRKILILLLIAGMILPAIIYTDNTELVDGISGNKMDILITISYILQPAAAIVGLILIAFTYKDAEIYRIYLSQGNTKFQILLYDLLTIETLTIVLGFILLGIVVGITGIISWNTKIDHLEHLEYFFQLFIKALIIQLTINVFLLAIAHLTNSKVIAISAFFILLFLFFIITDLGSDSLFKRIIIEMTPYSLNYQGFVPRSLELRDGFFIIRYFAINIYLGYFGIRKREF